MAAAADALAAIGDPSAIEPITRALVRPSRDAKASLEAALKALKARQSGR